MCVFVFSREIKIPQIWQTSLVFVHRFGNLVDRNAGFPKQRILVEFFEATMIFTTLLINYDGNLQADSACSTLFLQTRLITINNSIFLILYFEAKHRIFFH